MLTTSVEAICLNYRPKKDNTYPIMLRLTKSGKRKYVSLGVSVKEEHWDFNKNTPKRNCPDKDVIISIIEKRTAAYREQINEYNVENKDYTLESLVNRVENPMNNQSVGNFIDYYIKYLQGMNRHGYAKTFAELKSSMLGYCKSLDIYFSDIDLEWLKGYEVHLRNRNYAPNSIGIRFRTLRALTTMPLPAKSLKRTITRLTISR